VIKIKYKHFYSFPSPIIRRIITITPPPPSPRRGKLPFPPKATWRVRRKLPYPSKLPKGEATPLTPHPEGESCLPFGVRGRGGEDGGKGERIIIPPLPSKNPIIKG